MMYVHDKPFKLNNEEEIANFDPFKANDVNFNKMVWKKDYDHKYKLRNGIAKCTKNIRSRRFKRKIRYNHDEILDVAKKLKSIIDNGAANFENQNKNKDSVVDDEEMTFKNTDNQSLIHSEINAPVINRNNANNNIPISLPSSGVLNNNANSSSRAGKNGSSSKRKKKTGCCRGVWSFFYTCCY